MLLAHPSDLPWFVRPDRLPGLPRAARVGSAQPVLQIVSAPLLRPGLALIDAPDFDSVVAANRALARELLAAADLWLFVTTGRPAPTRPVAGAARRARPRGRGGHRGRPVAAGVGRPDHRPLRRDAGRTGAGPAPLFAVRESTLDGHGMVPEAEVAPVKQWLDGVAGSTNRRDELTRRTLLGALEATGPRLEALARAAEDQSAATAALAGTVRSSYATAMTDVQARVRSGAVLRGDVYAAWRELVAGGGCGRHRHRGRTPPGPPPDIEPRPASAGASRVVVAALAALVTEADLLAAQRCQRAWRAHPAGRAMLAADPTLGRPWAGFGDAAHDLVHGWQTTLRELAREVSPAEGVALLAAGASVAPPIDDITGTGSHAVALRTRCASLACAVGDRMQEEFVFRAAILVAGPPRRTGTGRRGRLGGSRSGCAASGACCWPDRLAGPPGHPPAHNLSTMDQRGYGHGAGRGVPQPVRLVREAVGAPGDAAYGGRESTRPSTTGLVGRIDALDRFRGSSRPTWAGRPRRCPRQPCQRPRLVTRARARLDLGATGYTVVALAGATGSGKSTLFNALARMDLSPPGELRPTTNEAHACVWGDGDANALLDWLQVAPSRRFRRESALDAEDEAPLRGMVLLDLPDLDSVATGHRTKRAAWSAWSTW
jgi:hypothetical protein